MLIKAEKNALLRRPLVSELTGLPRSTLYDYIRRGLFPAPVRLGARSVAWHSHQVLAWIESRQPTKGAAE